MQGFSKFILKLMGWKIINEIPDINKAVICVAPHTSNWDFIIGKLFYTSLGRTANFLIKDEWLQKPIIGSWLKWIGGIGVVRSKKTSLTDQLAEKFKKADKIQLAITPEGMRKANPDWKRGFYYIAKKAEVPIMIMAMDFKLKEVSMLGVFTPTDNEEEDIKAIKRYYVGITGKKPENFDLGDI